MGYIVRLHETCVSRPVMIGRVPTARDAFALQRRWREEHPESWVEIVPPRARPWDDVA